MNTKAELAGRIVELVSGTGADAVLLGAAVAAILEDYRIERQPLRKRNNLMGHVTAFLAAKRIEGLAASTLKNYELYLRRFAKEMETTTPRVTTEDIRTYVGGLQLADSSLQTVLATLRSFFGWLHREEIIKKNPMLKIPSGKTGARQLRKALSPEALEQLRQAAGSKREKALIEFLFSTGCRVSEVAGIRLPEVDFSQRSARVLGKGGKERVVYFSVRAHLLLLDYLHDRKGGGAALFTNTRAPGGPMSARSIQKAVKALGQRAALPQAVHPHLLRHTFATLSLNNGMDITVIQKLLGHSQLSTTQIYASISMANVRYEYEKCVS